ncbi:Si-specific NAD(P)(+) transhydrogenase [soil metagenome]
MAYDFDLVVLGAGPAGEKGAVQAAYFGKRVAIVERETEPGGAAVHTGTLPSKTLRETAIFLSGYRQRELYGVTVALDEQLAVPKLLSRKNAVRELEVKRIDWNLDRHSVTRLAGMARFVDPHTVELVDERGAVTRKVTSEFFLVAPGSTPFRPSNIAFDDEDIDDSDTILLLGRLPKKMIVIGGGVIGCEYATMFAALKVEVTLIEGRARLLPFLDFEMGERLRGAMQNLGIDFYLEAQAKSVERKGKDIVVELQSGDVLHCDRLLFAAGRTGRSADLDLAKVGVTADKRGYIPVDDSYCTTTPSIYAAGDVIGFPALASTSMDQARIAVCHAFGLSYKKPLSHLLPYGVYTIPEVSCVGFSEEQATEQKLDFAVGRAFYRDNARGKIIGDKDGVIKLVFEKGTRKLLGAHCIGDRASELVHIGQAMITLGGTVDTIIDMVFNYPTLAEMFKYAAYDALPKL